jgi:hypothetical protein
MKLWFGLIAIHLAGFVFGQEVLSKIPVSGKSIVAFIPKDYDTLEVVKGDLNKDNIADVAMVLKSKEEDKDDANKSGDELPPRLLLVLLKQADGYKLAAKSDSAILCGDCGGVFGDPFAGITIVKGVLIVDHFGGSAWRWGTTHRFRYQQNDFYLIGKTSHSFWNVKFCDKLNDFAGTSVEDINLLTGSYVEKEISEECVLKKNKKGKKKVEPLIKLSSFSIDN